MVESSITNSTTTLFPEEIEYFLYFIYGFIFTTGTIGNIAVIYVVGYCKRQVKHYVLEA